MCVSTNFDFTVLDVKVALTILQMTLNLHVQDKKQVHG